MNVGKRWRYALIISLTLNIFLLCGLGLLSAGIFTAQPMEEIIELELVSEEENQQPIVSNVEQENTSGKTPMKSSNTETLSTKASFSAAPVAIQKITSLTIDEVSTDHSTYYDTSETQGASLPAGGGEAVGNSSSGQPSNGKASGGSGSGSGKKSGGLVRPIILSQVDPIYPKDAYQAGIVGTVSLKVEILESGRAGEIIVKQSAGNSSLDESALAAVAKWRFTPAKERDTGRAVKCYITRDIVFRIVQ